MKSVKCDECGKKETLLSKIGLRRPSGHDFTINEWEFCIPKSGYYKEGNYTLHLCPECIEIARWFEEQLKKAIKKDKVASKLCEWLKTNEGRKVTIDYDTTEGKDRGADYSKSGEWIVSKPNRSRKDDYSIEWKIFEYDDEIYFSIDKSKNTYRELKIENNILMYTEGRKDYIDPKTGDRLGLAPVQKKSGVDEWYYYKFNLK